MNDPIKSDDNFGKARYKFMLSDQAPNQGFPKCHSAGRIRLDEPPSLQILHDSADHFTRSTHHLGNILARDLLVDHHGTAITWCSMLNQCPADAAMDIHKCQRFDLAICLTQALYKARHHGMSDMTVVLHTTHEI